MCFFYFPWNSSHLSTSNYMVTVQTFEVMFEEVMELCLFAFGSYSVTLFPIDFL
jgi:hypothetical protein